MLLTDQTSSVMDTVLRYIRTRFSIFDLPSRHPANSACTYEASVVSSVPSSASALQRDQYPFHLDPKRVAASRHDAPPKHLPGPRATQQEVRYFLFHLLTYKQYKCAKNYPEWVLETCMAWTGMGHQMYDQDEEWLRNICPPQAAAQGILSKRHVVGAPCPPSARTMIGEIVVAFVLSHRDRRHGKPSVKQEWERELIRARSSPLLRSESLDHVAKRSSTRSINSASFESGSQRDFVSSDTIGMSHVYSQDTREERLL